MSSIVLDGKFVSSKIRTFIKNEITKNHSGQLPKLATILVGNDPASETYVQMKIKACQEIGMLSSLIHLPKSTTTNELIFKIQDLNNDPTVHGILLQHPTPSQIDERLAFDAISILKDVDGVTRESFSRLAFNLETFYPCTPYGIIYLMKEYGIQLEGKRVAIVGRSPILGKPLALLLSNLNSTVTICHSKTMNLPEIISQSEIIIGALGKPEFIQSDWVRDGSILIDAGYNPGNIGDIQISLAKEKSSYHTPVPGGVGPMTIAILLLQTYYSYQNKFSPKMEF